MKYKTWILLICLFPGVIFAANKYVSDELVITLRTGQGNQFEIIKTLKSGAKLEVLDETDTGYTLVRTDDGTEGWVRTKYLSDEPTAATKLDKAQAKIASLSEKLASAQSELRTLRKEKGKLDSNLAKLKGEHESASKELAHMNELASRPKQLARENKELRMQYEQIRDELVLVKQENQVLKDRSKRNWFLAGAGVVILGMIIGLVIAKLRFRKKDRWGDY